MKLVPSLPQYHVYDGAAIVPVLGGEAVVLNFEFLDDLNRGRVVDVGIAAFALFGRAQRAAVQANFRGRVALTVRNEVRARRVVVVDPNTAGFRDPPGQENQVVVSVSYRVRRTNTKANLVFPFYLDTAGG